MMVVPLKLSCVLSCFLRLALLSSAQNYSHESLLRICGIRFWTNGLTPFGAQMRFVRPLGKRAANVKRKKKSGNKELVARFSKHVYYLSAF